jgi:hypothetical protein
MAGDVDLWLPVEKDPFRIQKQIAFTSRIEDSVISIRMIIPILTVFDEKMLNAKFIFEKNYYVLKIIEEIYN